LSFEAVRKVEIPRLLRDFQAQWEPRFPGVYTTERLFHSFSPADRCSFSPFSRVACASIRRAFDTVGVVHQPLEVFDERPFAVVAESGFFLEGARAEIVAAIHNQIGALAELKK
jgi:hypothetical protein